MTDINVTTQNIEINVGESIDLNNIISILPANATNPQITFEIGSNILSISNGVIKGISKGNTTVKILSVENPEIYQIINITVNELPYLEFSKEVNIVVENSVKYIKNLPVGTTLANLNKYIKTNYNITLKDVNNSVINITSSLLKTGMKLDINDTTYVIVIKGDINGDGKYTITDLSQLRYHLAKVSGKEKSGANKLAGDLNNDNKVSITDLSRMRKELSENAQ
jgi:hypothetical protein